MDNPNPPSARIHLHPTMAPERLPGFDVTKMSEDEFRVLMRQVCEYREVYAPQEGLSYRLRGIFQARGGRNNIAYLRIAIEETHGEEIASMDLDPGACIRLAGYLLEFGVSLANINCTPEVIADLLTNTLEQFLHPKNFQIIKKTLMVALEEELKAKIAVHATGKTQKA